MNDDPTAPLWDFIVVDGRVMWRTEEPQLACPCNGLGVLAGEWLWRRKPMCTCGMGDPEDISILHSVECDTVPCPFCTMETT